MTIKRFNEWETTCRMVWAAAFATEARLRFQCADGVLTAKDAAECAAAADAAVRLLAKVELP